ncbi:hypothetical protein NHX12_003205 [Muraenolepis orangiensis]|uniref:FerIin domain-containing protein n=1 Tax=Muraenolepis orangiensis TaxID=630683 RepID=A0A9Q0DXL2_9TELE|nr:hypothetical protein NHX12_003205 [Muraenolepis orangiensis]
MRNGSARLAGFSHKTRVLQCESVAVFNEHDGEALDRETRRLGRALVRTRDTEEDDEDDEDDITDIEASNIVLTPLLSRSRPLSRHVLAAIPRVQSFQNFMFDFQETADILFDQVIEIKVFHRRTLAFLMSHIGTFKIDLATIYSQPEHSFYQKWAPLSDPGDTRAGVKGYVKASLSVLMKGDELSMPNLAPPSSSTTNQDIDK